MFYCFQISYRLMMTEKKIYCWLHFYHRRLNIWALKLKLYIFKFERPYFHSPMISTHTYISHFCPFKFFLKQKIIFQIFLMIQTRFGQKRVLVSAHCLLHFYVHMPPWNLKTKRIFSKNRTTQQKHHLFFSLLYKYILNKVYKIH